MLRSLRDRRLLSAISCQVPRVFRFLANTAVRRFEKIEQYSSSCEIEMRRDRLAARNRWQPYLESLLSVLKL